ncbi:MAG: hypothetical protein ACYDCC_08740 [Actinomycetota bacterium]
MHARTRVFTFAAVVLVVTACQAGPSRRAVTPSHTVRLSISNFTFDRSIFAATEGDPFTLALQNRDAGINHNVEIMAKPFGYYPKPPLFFGDIIKGPATIDYHVPALPAGHLYFVCYVHHDVMFGAIDVAPIVQRAPGGATLTWATRADFPPGYLYDVELKTQSSNWRMWLHATRMLSAVRSASPGQTLSFRVAQYIIGSSAITWSPVVTIQV